ncbi:MAG TPA: 4Fe-4S dicluster domain-containing protein [Terriglobia bacterium]|nr:4Fe-4S dicluster domain-containing protein [Terriglobia bacterium]
MAETLLVQPDSEFIEGVMASGAHDFKKCFQCATCSAVCTLSNDGVAFPRKQMIEAQWGLKDKLLEDPGPWLCFYCGECSKNCPRKANPAETMMALRRYLTAEYDWTGLSRLMYRSAFWEIGILALVSAIIVALFTVPQNFGFGLLSRSGPAPLSSVMLGKFAPVGLVDLGDRMLVVVLSFFLLTNAARMFYRLTRGQKIPARLYLMCLPHLILQAATQKRWKECKDSEATKNWVRHLLLVTGYVIMFTLVVVFLPWFQVDNSSIRWTSFLGYYATAVLVGATVWMLIDRIRKRGEMYQFSHLSDWLFPILLFLTAVTGIGLHVLRVNDFAMATYVMYTVHMAIAVPMLAVEVPFGKWAHLLYRPLAIYVAAVRREATGFSSREVAPIGRVIA